MITIAEIKSLIRGRPPFQHLKQLHCILITSSLSDDTKVLTNLLVAAASLSPPHGDISYAALVFHQLLPPRSADAWNAMIRAHVLIFKHQQALDLYSDMLREGCVPNKHTYPLLLRALSKAEHKNPDRFHAHIWKFVFGSDLFVQNALISSYLNGGLFDSARTLFGKMRHRDSVSWTSMVHGYIKSGQTEEGLRLFLEMRVSSIAIDEVIIASVLTGAGIAGNLWLGRSIHSFYMVCGRVRSDIYVSCALISMYCKCDHCDDARRFFDTTSSKNVVSWSAMISCYVKSIRFKDALDLFKNMITVGVEPNEVTLASVLTACAELGALGIGKWVHDYIDNKKLKLNSILRTALLDMYAKCGCIDQAVALFKSLQHKDVELWTALINGFAVNGLSCECLDLFSQMLMEGVRPNKVTFIGVLAACSHGGLVDEGRSYFERMHSEFGIKPSLEHYGCIVDLLGRAGQLEEALSFIKTMPMEPSAGIWGALSRACIIYKDFALGERVGKHLLEIQPYRSGRYALLANMHSLSHNWEAAAKVRMAMKGRRVEKTPGWSWLEVKGELHEFKSMDVSHCQSQDIYETLDGVSLLMKLDSERCLLSSTLSS